MWHIAKESQAEILKYLEIELLKITPAVKIRGSIRNIDDVYKNRAILKECRWDFESFDYLLSIFVDTVSKDLPFRKKVDCFKVVRFAIKYSFGGCQFPENILDKLFYLFREFIQVVPTANDDVVSWLSVALKGQVLKDDIINWLIQHVSEDETILNRLLRYPTWNKLIEQWAIQSVESNLIDGREAELYGILIKDKIPDILKDKDSKHLAWGIYYSKTDEETKERLLLAIADKSNYRAVCDISYRLNFPNVTKALVEMFESSSSPTS